MGALWRGRRRAGSAVSALISVLGAATATAAEPPSTVRASTAEGAPQPPRPTAGATAAESRPEERAPAEDLVLSTGLGYGVGASSAIAAQNPKVLHGLALRVGAGFAWAVRRAQSVGLELSVDAIVDRERTTGGDTALGGRYGVGAFVIGEKAHVRATVGLARSTFDGVARSGIGIGFAAGWHVPIVAGARWWKRPVVTADLAPSWDFLGAGSETLHRWSFAILVGVAAY
jgi:hypothetical protein